MRTPAPDSAAFVIQSLVAPVEGGVGELEDVEHAPVYECRQVGQVCGRADPGYEALVAHLQERVDRPVLLAVAHGRTVELHDVDAVGPQAFEALVEPAEQVVARPDVSRGGAAALGGDGDCRVPVRYGEADHLLAVAVVVGGVYEGDSGIHDAAHHVLVLALRHGLAVASSVTEARDLDSGPSEHRRRQLRHASSLGASIASCASANAPAMPESSPRVGGTM